MKLLSLLRTFTPLGKLVIGIVLLIALILAGLFIRDLLVGSSKVQSRLSTNQADAALQSGKDAAQTVGRQAETEAARNRSVTEMQKEVDDAETDADAHAAGAQWLCLDFGICSEQ